MLAGQVMSPIVLAVSLDASIYEAAEVMVSAEVSALPVVDGNGRMVGILSEADLMHRRRDRHRAAQGLAQRLLGDSANSAHEYVALHSRRVRDVMTRKVVTVDEQTPLSELAALMDRHKIKRVPVMRGDTVVGIVSRGNLLRALLSRDPQQPASPQSDEALRRAVEAAVKGRPGNRRGRSTSSSMPASSISGASSPATPRRRPIAWPPRTCPACTRSRTTCARVPHGRHGRLGPMSKGEISMSIALEMTTPLAGSSAVPAVALCRLGHRLRRRGRESPACDNGRDFGISAADLRRRRLANSPGNKVEIVNSYAIPDMPGKRVTVVRVTYGPGGFRRRTVMAAR